MDIKKTTTGAAIGTAMIMGGVDASVLDETPLERVEMVAGEEVVAVQIENTVETTFPWKDQPGFVVKYDLGEPDLIDRFIDRRDKEIITEVVTDFEGGFKVDVLLNERPNTNVFCYAIEGHENYDFFYQPPLTEEEKAQGLIRPPEIEGSYAVYHKTLANNDYKTGKVMHIPRPQVWEFNDESTKIWADMTFTDGNLCVTVPQDFLDTATYPVRVDPTFGYTSVGATSQDVFTGTGPYTFTRVGNVSTTTTAGAVVGGAAVLVEASGSSNDITNLFLNIQNGSGLDSHTEIMSLECDNTCDIPTTATFTTFVGTPFAIASGTAYIPNVVGRHGSINITTRYDSSGSAVYYLESIVNASVPTGYNLIKETPWTTAPSGTGRVYSSYITFVTIPTVTTLLSEIASPRTITVSGVTTNSEANTSVVGFVYGTDPLLTAVDTATTTKIQSLGNPEVQFSITLTGLTPNTTYYFRAFAQNSAGTGYGEILSFTTASQNTIRMDNGTIRINNGRLDI